MNPSTKNKLIKLFEGEFEGYLYLDPKGSAKFIADEVEKIIDEGEK